MSRGDDSRGTGKADQRVSRIEIANNLLDEFIEDQQSERKWNNFRIFLKACFTTWVVYSATFDRGFSQVFDWVLLVGYLIWIYFDFRRDRRIVASIKQAERQKAEWEEKRKAFGAQ